MGDKQIRFDSLRPSPLKPYSPSPSPVPKKVPVLRKKIRSAIFFWSPYNEFLFRRLSVFVVFGFDIACILLTRSSSHAKLF